MARPVTTNQPPHRPRAARVRSVRARVTVNARPATRNRSAAGSNHAIWPPNAELNIRVSPVGPQLPVPPCPPPPTLPDSLPVSRPKPLYPNNTFQKLLFCEPPMYGRLDAGHNSTIATHQPPAASVTRPS